MTLAAAGGTGGGSAPAEQLYRLDNPVQHYAWGSPTVIPDLLGTPPSDRPVAELWVGANPGAPSMIVGSEPPQTLAALIANDPVAFLGSPTAQGFGQLPYLLKVLAIARPLSLQAHPSRSQAEAGFAAERVAGIPADALARNYKDANHKPEQVCALTDFEGLCGFRPVKETATFLEELAGASELDGSRRPTPRLSALRGRLLGPDGLVKVVGELLTGPAAMIEDLLGELIPSARAVHRGGGRWAAEAGWLTELERAYPGDRGAVLAALLNLVVLRPGQALFLHAGQLHAYLRGVAVEVMANSDNVLRGGLTPKNVDADALLAILDVHEERVEPAAVPDHDGSSSSGHWYPSGVPDFRLGRLELAGPVPVVLPAGSPRILLCTDGAAVLRTARSGSLELRRGQAGFAPAGAEVRVFAGDGAPATVFGVSPNTSGANT